MFQNLASLNMVILFLLKYYTYETLITCIDNLLICLWLGIKFKAADYLKESQRKKAYY